ncbi:LysM peptidoglycan-binding domain-containing protein [Sporosarcina sp. P17b]|uniref:LysM peptidoglycan-binding domain-containing protein n=1 Tax=Sporosarcina sp. P17b TaxID=2048260 RepID=UPI000C1719A4|nr:LysM peptidoglycan-binding domain-containing protein [Sporosarcina sp. P17b]PIC72434.1 hypothetical protein CSV76_15430 [Sporosarcina sp. P17b]
MEIWLSMDDQRFRLPVLPEEFEVKSSNTNEKVMINTIGMINLLGKSELEEVDIVSFFPSKEYSFVAYKGFPPPWKCVELIKKWKSSGKPLRLIITQTGVNMEVGIENFDHGIRDGTKDVYYTLLLSEYVRIKKTKNNSTKNEAKTKRPAPTKTKEKKTYTVKKGDTLWLIAQKQTGNAMNYEKIAKENKIKNPNKLIAGQKLII